MKAEDANRAHWDEIAPVHLRAYRVDTLLSGVSLIDEIQKGEFYPIAGKQLLHLQCHIGTDTLSLALDGAQVTGVDFSPGSIQIARELAQKMGIPAEFHVANVLDLAENHPGGIRHRLHLAGRAVLDQRYPALGTGGGAPSQAGRHLLYFRDPPGADDVRG